MAAEENDDKAAEAAKIVKFHSIGSVASGILPIPLLDIAILGGIQLRMLERLADLYGVEFSKQRANAFIGSLAGVSAVTTATTLLRWAGLAGLPLTIGALVTLPASTYAIGRVFTKHFESGGTFLNFDPARAKKDYDDELAKGRTVVEQSYTGIKP